MAKKEADPNTLIAPESVTSETLANFDPQAAIASGELKKVPITSIIPDATGLRKNVDKDHKDWNGLVNSIKREGIFHAIVVRVNNLPEAEHPYVIVDGLHRFTAAMQIWDELNASREAAGQPPLSPDDYQVPVNIVNVNSAMDVYRLQLAGNTQQIDTKPVQVRDHLLAMIAEAEANDEVLTQADLAREINKSQAYVSQILRMKNLTPEIAKQIDGSGMSVSNAHNLAKLPPEEQADWLDRAKTMDSQEFALQVGQELTKIKEALAADRKARGDEFAGVAPKLLKKPDALKLMDNWIEEHLKPRGGEPFIQEVLSRINDEDESGARIHNDEFNAFLVGTFYGFQLMLQVDSDTVNRKKAEHEAQVAEKARKKAQEDAKKNAQKAAERGVGILMPEGKSKPVGFGSSEPSESAEPAAEAEPATA